MINRTENGYELGGWECTPMQLPTGHKLTPTEARAAVCKINGMSQKEAAQLMSCSVSNVRQMWTSLYYKTVTHNAIVTLTKLVDFGAMHRVHLLLAALLFTWTATPAMNLDPDTQTVDLARRSRSQRRSGLGNNAKLQSVALLLGDAVFDLYSISDLEAFHV